jgi:hypothetical protein
MGGWGQGEDVELGGTRQVQVFARPARKCRFSPVQVFASAGFRLSLHERRQKITTTDFLPHNTAAN